MTSAPVPRTGSQPGSRAPNRISWGLPDAALVWVAAGVVANVAGIPFYDGPGEEPSPLESFGVLLPVQQLTVILGLVFVSRFKGQGSLRRDFGLELRTTDARGLVWGVGLQFLLTLSVLPLSWLSDGSERQQLLEDLEKSRQPLTIVFFFLGAVVMAPLVEELLYRGLLLRALLRRVGPGPAVFVSAIVFAVVHVVGDTSALEFVPALAGLGIVLGVVAVRTGDLSLPILIHAGFNLTTAVAFLTFDLS